MSNNVDWIDTDYEYEIAYVRLKYKDVEYRVMLNFENEPDENKLVVLVDKYTDHGIDTTDVLIGTQRADIDLDGKWE